MKIRYQKTTLGWVGGIVAIAVAVCGLLAYVLKAGGQVKTLEMVNDTVTQHLDDEKRQLEKQAVIDDNQTKELGMYKDFLNKVDRDQAITQEQLKAIQTQLVRIENALEAHP